MALTTVSVIMTVTVLNFFYRGPNLTPVPAWARRYGGVRWVRGRGVRGSREERLGGSGGSGEEGLGGGGGGNNPTKQILKN